MLNTIQQCGVNAIQCSANCGLATARLVSDGAVGRGRLKASLDQFTVGLRQLLETCLQGITSLRPYIILSDSLLCHGRKDVIGKDLRVSAFSAEVIQHVIVRHVTCPVVESGSQLKVIELPPQYRCYILQQLFGVRTIWNQ